METASTRKLYLIKTIQTLLNTIAEAEVNLPLLVLASTGVAVFNINGLTINLALSIPIYTKNFDIDFGQLLPVLDLFIYAINTLQDLVSNDGLVAYTQFKEVYKLNVIKRQSKESERQRIFRDILLQLHNDKSTLSDWETLTSRFEDKITSVERQQFLEAIFISPKWSDVDRINLNKLMSLNYPVAKILAVHTGGPEAKRVDSDVVMGLEAQLLLAKVQDILYNEHRLLYFLVAVLISFKRYNGSTITIIEDTEVVPIAPIRYTREAITVYKSQGLTLSKAVIDLGNKEFAADFSL
ncbi:19296_t:CDS:2 [Racocetra persica]|uniref:19296_t:CDS:1 n=1 Tax=Racocetra persica TaxID=160502 RepID=A0ACA9KIY1_9GLOM|nr:19296_t:CDS:2 [Racocetra persica]